jgi:hypothetical protein
MICFSLSDMVLIGGLIVCGLLFYAAWSIPKDK